MRELRFSTPRASSRLTRVPHCRAQGVGRPVRFFADAGRVGAAPASSDSDIEVGAHCHRTVEREVVLVHTDTHHAARVLRQASKLTDRS
jgi:hypothetical protein